MARTCVWGLNLAYAVDGAGTAEVYHTDGLGSVRAVTDAAGKVVQTYQTDEFGVPTQTYGARVQPLGYTGEPRDPTGLVNLRARLYDPQVGRFLSRDPFAGMAGIPLSLNRHSYVHNNPVNFADPSGLALSRILRDVTERLNRSCLDADSLLTCFLFGPRPGPLGLSKIGASPIKDISPIGGDDAGRGAVKATSTSYAGGGVSKARRLWEITEEGTDRVLIHDRFGAFHRRRTTQLWWTRD